MIFSFLTIISYGIGILLFKRQQTFWLNPIIISPILIISFLLITHTDYQIYEHSTKPLSYFMGPLQVALAIPMFKYWKTLKKQLSRIVISVFAGSFAGIASAAFIGHSLGLESSIILSMIPKSATAPIALEASIVLGGIPEMTGMFVVFTGIFGMLIGPSILKWTGINNNVDKGLAMGATAQIIGAVHASKWGESAGAMGMVGMLLSGLMIGLSAQFLSAFL
nr:LrgB family protein [Mesobacillus harenae]